MAEKLCEHCGHRIPNRCEVLGLVSEVDPPAAYFHGKKIQNLTPTMLRILDCLIRHKGRAPTALILMTGSENFDERGLRTQISKMRRRLEDQSLGLIIEAIQGWGYGIRDGNV